MNIISQAIIVNNLVLIPKGQFTPLSQLTVEGMISSAVNIVLIVASVLFLFSFLIGGIKFIISAGSKDKLDTAKRQLLNAIIGILIVFSAWSILSFIGEIYGIDFTTFQIPTI